MSKDERTLPRRLYRSARIKVKEVWREAALKRALRRRTRQTNVDYIGVAGSCGKTTTLHLIAAALPAVRSMQPRYYANYRQEDFVALIKAADRGARFAVAEFTGSPVGQIEKRLPLVRPTIGVITAIGNDHFVDFRGPENAAREKQKLIQALPSHGVAVLNADDPNVRPMAKATKARVITFGTGPDADVRGEEIAADWPDRLSMIVRHRKESVHLQTQFVGRPQVPSVLAAMATALAAGVALTDAATRIAETPPITGRMCPVEGRDGVVFLDDGMKAPLWTMETALDVLRTARARRKVAVIGHISDYSGKARRAYGQVARAALTVADEVVFVGPLARQARHGLSEGDERRLRLIETARAARYLLHAMLQPGDLVLLKGSNTADHLERFALAHCHRHNCWREKCGKRYHCTLCRYRYQDRE